MANVMKDSLERWTREMAVDLYAIRNWGMGYFDISESGEVIVRPRPGKDNAAVSIMELIAGAKARGLTCPVLFRFADILAARIEQIYEAFNGAIKDAGYQGKYQGVYPIKVNQQQEVVAEIMEFGARFHHGLEAGSKAELIAAIAYTSDRQALIVCNGYKDEEFIDMALYAQRMGLQPIIVIEMPQELPLVLRRSAALGIRPLLGVRVKLSSRAGGHWEGSGGDRSVFGVTAGQIIEIVDTLRAQNMLDCLKMLHYHIGSQVPNIRDIRHALREACRFYVELAREGAAMGFLNVGGGLAVDYDGSHTNFAGSRNYTEREYADDIIEAVMRACSGAGIPHPTIVSESGRATVAYHSVLVFNVLDVSRFEPPSAPQQLPEPCNEMLQNLMEVRATLTPKNLQEKFHDAVDYRDQIRALFQHEEISLRERAIAENIFWDIIRQISAMMPEAKYVPDELKRIKDALADLYYCNFSVFQSLPDSWAIDQLFPVMPVHRLCEMPTRQAILSDITCDSDGKIDKFIDPHGVRHTLSVHELNGEDYYLGVFLIGAYQETLGDLHNLMGDTNVLHVRLGPGGRFEYEHEICGDTVADVLSYVEYDPKSILERLRNLAEQSVRENRITPKERKEIMDAFEAGMRGYTYYEA